MSLTTVSCLIDRTDDLRNLWSYVFCTGVPMAIVADHLDDAGFNGITKGSLLSSVPTIKSLI